MVTVAAAVMAAAVNSFPTTTLRNGVEMPTMLLGTGAATWNNNTSTELSVTAGLLAGFPGVDTANHYRNQVGVAAGVAAARRQGVAGKIWLQTKVEGCGNSIASVDGVDVLPPSCYNDTLAVVDQNLKLLNVETVDLTLLHSPPCVPNAPWISGKCGGMDLPSIYPTGCDCSQPAPCAMMREQWRALERAYADGKTRAIGVSNYCDACLACITSPSDPASPAEPAAAPRVIPHVNQFQLHAGMDGGPDPSGLVSASEARGMRVQVYRALAQGTGALFHHPTVEAVAAAHNKSAAQVLLKWPLQLGHALLTSATNPDYMSEDLAMFDWQLSDAEMGRMGALRVQCGGTLDNPVGTMCHLG
jgi:diketogulonate reductase-like aldo/keto reductase